MAEWSKLLRDPLELILEKLDLSDHARFASVCSSWRSVAINNPPINKPLYLALSHDPKNLLRRFITSLIPSPSWKHVTFIGVLDDGWLAILIDRKDLFLLNKTFNSMIPLPSPPDPYNYLFYRPRYCKVVLSSPPSSSSGECTIVLKLSSTQLYYCRLGSDKSFTEFLDTSSGISFGLILDILFYKGRLYVLCSENTIRIFDNFHNRGVTQLVASLDCKYELYQLLISGNTLLMSTARLDPPLIFKFEENKLRAVQVSNINDNCVLFINYVYSVSITFDEHKKFRLNNPPVSFDALLNTYVLDMRKDPYVIKVGDPCQLYFSMFEFGGIDNETLNGP